MSFTIYLDRKYIQVSQSEFEALLPGRLKGQGAFETMRLYNKKVFAFHEHISRLRRGCKHFGLSIFLSEKKILNTIQHLSKLNALKNARVRVIVWRDKKRHILISVNRLALPSKKKYSQGFKVVTASLRRNRTSSSHIKSINYHMFRHAFNDAIAKGYDEAILLNKNGHIVEGSRTNIFFIKNGCLHTPPIQSGCLNGITRSKVISCARCLKIPVNIKPFKRSELLFADEAFLTGSTLEVMPIQRIDQKKIGKSGPRAITSLIQKTYSAAVKKSLSQRR